MTFNDYARLVIGAGSVAVLVYVLGWVKGRLEQRKRQFDEYWRHM